MNKKIITFVIISIAVIVGAILIWNNQKNQNTQQAPQTSEEIQKEIERLQKLIKIIDEDNQKVENGKVACIQVYQPVCGTDGRTYSNDCFASAAGVEITHQGECK